MGDNKKWWLAILSPILALVFFVVTNALINPAQAQAQQVHENTGEIIVLKEQFKGLGESLMNFIKRNDDDHGEIKDRLDKLLDLHIR